MSTRVARRRRKHRQLPKSIPLPGAVGVGGLWAMERHVLKGLRGAAERATSLELLPADDDREPYQRFGSTAIIDIGGIIVSAPSLFGRLFGGETSLGFIKRAVHEAVADESVARILIVFDSPGGTGLGLQDVADAIFNADTKFKPVFSHTTATMASAAYFLASQARRIFVGPDSLTGSVGILYVLDDVSKMFEMKGVKTEIFASGRFKGIGVAGTSLKQEDRGELQKMVDDVAAVFLKAVQRGRRLNPLQVAEFADGRLHAGESAVRIGLADEVATIDQTFAAIAGGNADGPTLSAAATAPAPTASKAPDPPKQLTESEIQLIVGKERARLCALDEVFNGFDFIGLEELKTCAIMDGWPVAQVVNHLLERIKDQRDIESQLRRLPHEQTAEV